MESDRRSWRAVTIGRRGAITAALLSPMIAKAGATESSTSPTDLQGIFKAMGLLLPGHYTKADLDLGKRPICLVAAVPGTVEITIPPGEYLIDTADFVDLVCIDGIRFWGGAGVLRLSNKGPNVGRAVRITRCEFNEYTHCAIGNNSTDHPYLLVQDCRFQCREGSYAIGVAWGGYADGSVIERCAFLRNSYHLKIGPRLSGTIAIHKNDFILFGGQRQADIWIVPNSDMDWPGLNAGFGSSICYNKFGNENLAPSGCRILIAPENLASGQDRLSRRHLPAATNSAFVSGLTIAHNRISGISHLTGPFLHSYVTNFRYFTWYSNNLDGGAYPYLVGMEQGDKLSPADLFWNIKLDPADGPALPERFTNVTAFTAQGSVAR